MASTRGRTRGGWQSVSVPHYAACHGSPRGCPSGCHPVFRETITADVSQFGWGAAWHGRPAQGRWNAHDCPHHINVLELRSVHLALWHSFPHVLRRHVLVRSDNRPVDYINHQGGTMISKGYVPNLLGTPLPMCSHNQLACSTGANGGGSLPDVQAWGRTLSPV